MINQLIKDALEQRGRGARSQLARDVDVAPQTVTKWVKGEITPERDRLPDIEAALGMPSGELLAAGGFTAPQPGSILDRLDRIERHLGLGPIEQQPGWFDMPTAADTGAVDAEIVSIERGPRAAPGSDD